MLRNIFYINRIVLAWNSLNDTVITAPSVNAFRKQLNTVNLEKFLNCPCSLMALCCSFCVLV